MSDKEGLLINKEGYFERSGRLFVPIGVNYWPASCGMAMWRTWPETEIQKDLDLIKTLGMNSVRFFLRWSDFEPEAEFYDPSVCHRLESFLKCCSDRDLNMQMSLITGWMNGAVTWPDWAEGCNVFTDMDMHACAAGYAQRVAEIVAPFHPWMIGIDQGNELCSTPDSMSAPVQSINHWSVLISDAIHSVYPQCLILSGNHQAQFLDDTGWRPNEQKTIDIHSLHLLPFPRMHNVLFEGMDDPLAVTVAGYYTMLFRSFGPVLIQAIGTASTYDPEIQRRYLSKTLAECWKFGANGFFWWSLKDIDARFSPYSTHAAESALGLVDEHNRVKPGLECFLEFTHQLPQLVRPHDKEKRIGVYWPLHYYNRQNPLNPGNKPEFLSHRMLLCDYLLKMMDYETVSVRGDLPLNDEYSILFLPGTKITIDEAVRLEEWVKNGGKVIWHAPNPSNWGKDFSRLLGATPMDQHSSATVTVKTFGNIWRFDTFPHATRLKLKCHSAEVIAMDDRNMPMVLANRIGKGKVAYALPMVEDSIAVDSERIVTRDRWKSWYEGMLRTVEE